MSSRRYAINPLVLVATPTLEHRPISWQWHDAMQALQFPLGASVSRYRAHGKDVADARNEIVLTALSIGADYILFVGDDNIPPPNLFALLHRHREHLVTGVYWSKSYPTHPYLWDGMLKGFHEDWKLGEYFPVDFAGCDALLAHTDVFKAIVPPWFSRDWTFEPGQVPGPHFTEDFYLYTRAREAGFKLFVDTEAQLGHQDRTSGVIFGLTDEMPQMQKDAPHPSSSPAILVADIGSGVHSPWFGANATIRRYDLDPTNRPDVRCDVRAIPESDQTFDVVVASHLLEHFMWQEAPDLVREWTRILKVGGELRIVVPDIAYAAREILKADADEAYNVTLYPLWQLYGKQTGDPTQLHRAGFTRHGLRRLLELCGYADVEVTNTGDVGENLTATAVKRAHPEPLALGPIWRSLEEVEQAPTNGNGHSNGRNGNGHEDLSEVRVSPQRDEVPEEVEA